MSNWLHTFARILGKSKFPIPTRIKVGIFVLLLNLDKSLRQGKWHRIRLEWKGFLHGTPAFKVWRVLDLFFTHALRQTEYDYDGEGLYYHFERGPIHWSFSHTDSSCFSCLDIGGRNFWFHPLGVDRD